MLKGARNNNSPFFANEKAAIKKCGMVNERLRQYIHTETDLYKVTKFRLSKVIDYYELEFKDRLK